MTGFEIGTAHKYEWEGANTGWLLGNIIEHKGEFGAIVVFSTPHGTKVEMGVVQAAMRLKSLTEDEAATLANLHEDFNIMRAKKLKKLQEELKEEVNEKSD